MLLSDGEIRELIEQDVLVNADKNNVGTITCDLRTKRFVFSDGSSRAGCKLQHGDSAFVECVEGVQLPHTIAARVLLKNSRIREGLTLDAPLYFPGHRTIVYYRVTNVSTDTIILDSARPIAQIAFERVEKPVDNAYEGTFQDEMEFRGMGRYEDVYRDEIERVKSTADEIKFVERRMYGNVMAIMAILAGIFTLVNVNAQAMQADLKTMLTLNLTTVGSFSVLVALIGVVTGNVKGGGKRSICITCAIAMLCFGIAIACVMLLP